MQDQPSPPVTLILRRHLNHAAVSGYDRISEYIKGRIILRQAELNLLQRAIVRPFKRWHANSGSLWYGMAGMLTELRAGFWWLMRSGQVFHFVYGENSYRFMGVFKKIRHNFIICTYHTPPDRFNEVVLDREHLRHIDGIIVLCSVSHQFFADLIGPDKVHFIPHGVDTNYFAPAETSEPKSDGFKCIFVGSHLRDFELLADVARHYAETDPSVTFEVITLKRDFHHFDRIEGVTLRNGVSDQELKEAYQQSDLMVLPLKDATANNSLLEAMACGVPILATDLAGVRDYTNDACAKLVPKDDLAAFIEGIEMLRREPARLLKMGCAARALAETMSHEQVARLTQQMYADTIANRQVAATGNKSTSHG